MKDIHIAQIGEWFHNEDGFDFLSDQNMLEYDFIIIESDVFINDVRNGITNKVDKRILKLKEFIAVKDIPVVFICFKGGNFYVQNRQKNLSITELLGIEATETSSMGRKIEVNPDSLFTDFIKRYDESFEYKVSFVNHPGTSIGKAKAKQDSVGFYTRDFVFLPALAEDGNIDNEEFLHTLYEVCSLVRRGDNILHVPEWANYYLLPGEKDEKERWKKLKNEIEKLQTFSSESELRLATFLPLKQLWTGSGAHLENAVKNVFLELGFKMLPIEERRDDIIMEYNGQIIIGEIKGQNKSGAEKNAAQLEKWLSSYISNHDGANPKGLLIVNTFREQPLADRTEVSFPNQMLKYSIVRNHCLLTTLQLCGLLLFCRDNSDKKELAIKELLDTVGCYKNFEDWSKYIDSEEKLINKKHRKKNVG